MKSFVRFWKRDLTNKLIVLISLGLVAAVIAVAYLVIAMPQGKSLHGAAAEVIPWISSPTPIRRAPLPTMTVTASATPEEFAITPGFLPVAGATLAVPQPELPTAEPLPTLTATLEPLEPTACLKGLREQEGTVLEVLDGNTLRVLIDGLVYPVRYTAVEVPQEGRQRESAWGLSTKLLYGKKVSLYTDVSDRDPRGRLLRYVMVGDTFANLEMIRAGWGKLLPMPPDSACDAAFAQAEREAQQAGLGIWIPTPTPTVKH
jgi:endonuclease YncB( thermonuclease family)